MNLASVSTRLFLHDCKNFEVVKSSRNYDNLFRDIKWSDDGIYLMQVNPKGVVEILSTNDTEIRTLQSIPFGDTWSATFSRNGHRNVAIGTKTGNVLIWDTKIKNISKTLPSQSHQSPINFLSYNSKNTNLAATMQNGETNIYGLASNVLVLTVKLPYSRSISAMKFHQESRTHLGFAMDEGHVTIRDITSNKDKSFFENAHSSPVSDFAYSLINKDVMLSSGYDKMVHIYDIRLQDIVSTIVTNNILTSIDIDKDNYIAVGGKNGSILIYDLRNLEDPLKTIHSHQDEVRRVVFQPQIKDNVVNLSFREDIGMCTPKKISPVKRHSDLFVIIDSPNNVSMEVSNSGDKDSFLAMMGLDKSNIECEEKETSSISELFRRETRKIEIDRNLSKSSTPNKFLNVPSPAIASQVNLSHNGSEVFGSATDFKWINAEKQNKNEEKLLDEALTASLAEIAQDHRNQYLSTMMELTKQKLFMEKQLKGIHSQINILVQNQNEFNLRLSELTEILRRKIHL